MSNDAEPIATLTISGRGVCEMSGRVTIGRDPRASDGTTIQIDGDPLVSKSHVAIDLDQGDLVITDLGSSNGTYLHHRDGETAVPSDRWIPIPPDAEVEFGDQRMTIVRATKTFEPVAAADRGDGDAGDDDDTPVALARPIGVSCRRCQRSLTPGMKFCDGCGLALSPLAPPAGRRIR